MKSCQFFCHLYCFYSTIKAHLQHQHFPRVTRKLLCVNIKPSSTSVQKVQLLRKTGNPGVRGYGSAAQTKPMHAKLIISTLEILICFCFGQQTLTGASKTNCSSMEVMKKSCSTKKVHLYINVLFFFTELN